MTSEHWNWHRHILEADYMGRLRSVWHRCYGRGPLQFDDALHECCIRYASSYGLLPATAEQIRCQFAGLLHCLTRTLYHDSTKWLRPWPEGADGTPMDIAIQEELDETDSHRTIALLLEVVRRVDLLSQRQRVAFLAYCQFVEDHGGGSNDEFRVYAASHHDLDLTTNTLKAHLNAARRRLWSLLIADGIVPNEPLQLKKARSRWDYIHHKQHDP